jgi:hypothetical protein
MVICGTRTGASRYRERASKLPEHYLIAPLDADPGSMEWPVAGAAGVTLVVAGAPDDYVLRLTQALLADGAEMVMQLRDQPPVSFHQRNPTP